MNKETIKTHLKQYSILKRRGTTINHAFASAVAPVDEYSEDIVNEVLNELECTKDGEIMCVFCGREKAQTWDHLFALVKNNEPSGYGHKYGNLVPACKDCNSVKGNRDWETANDIINKDFPYQKKRVARVIKKHIRKYPPKGQLVSGKNWEKLKQIRKQILDLMGEADKVIKDGKNR